MAGGRLAAAALLISAIVPAGASSHGLVKGFAQALDQSDFQRMRASLLDSRG
jgi:hypothetical protein